MDPISITASCIGLTASIAKVGIGVHQFVRDVRDARSDMDAVSRELGSLNTVLEFVAEDVKLHGDKLEDNMRVQIVGIVGNCAGVMERLDTSLKKYQHDRMSAKLKWTMVGKMEMEGFSRELVAHRSTLDLTLNFMTYAITRDIKTDTEALLDDTADLKASTQEGMEKILAEIAALKAQLPLAADEASGSGMILQKYLDNMTTYAETAYAGSIPESDSESEDYDDMGRSDAETVVEDHPHRVSRGSGEAHEPSGGIKLGESLLVLKAPIVVITPDNIPAAARPSQDRVVPALPPVLLAQETQDTLPEQVQVSPEPISDQQITLPDVYANLKFVDDFGAEFDWGHLDERQRSDPFGKQCAWQVEHLHGQALTRTSQVPYTFSVQRPVQTSQPAVQNIEQMPALIPVSTRSLSSSEKCGQIGERPEPRSLSYRENPQLDAAGFERQFPAGNYTHAGHSENRNSGSKSPEEDGVQQRPVTQIKLQDLRHATATSSSFDMAAAQKTQPPKAQARPYALTKPPPNSSFFEDSPPDSHQQYPPLVANTIQRSAEPQMQYQYPLLSVLSDRSNLGPAQTVNQRLNHSHSSRDLTTPPHKEGATPRAKAESKTSRGSTLLKRPSLPDFQSQSNTSSEKDIDAPVRSARAPTSASSHFAKELDELANSEPNYVEVRDYTITHDDSAVRISNESVLEDPTLRTGWIRNFTLYGGDMGKKFRCSDLIRFGSFCFTYAICEALRTRDKYWLDQLLEAGVDVNVIGHPRGIDYETPLNLALGWNLGTAKKILSAGASVNGDMDPAAMTLSPLTHLIQKSKGTRAEIIIQVAKFLLSNGALLDAPPRFSCSALHAAVAMGEHPGVLQFLLQQGADPNRRSGRGGTPLQAAVLRKPPLGDMHRAGMISLLMDFGADPKLEEYCSYQGKGKGLLHSFTDNVRWEKLSALELSKKIGAPSTTAIMTTWMQNHKFGPLQKSTSPD